MGEISGRVGIWEPEIASETKFESACVRFSALFTVGVGAREVIEVVFAFGIPLELQVLEDNLKCALRVHTHYIYCYCYQVKRMPPRMREKKRNQVPVWIGASN